MSITGLGALGFGLIIGWYLYYINRYRKGDVQFSDITTVVAAIGGAGVLSLFPSGSELFGFYGIGLAVGFFAYFLVLTLLVGISRNFDSDWFLDGRRRDPAAGYSIPGDIRPTIAAMSVDPGALQGLNPGPTQQFFIGGAPVDPAAALGVPRPASVSRRPARPK
jgi:hypothetical protein